MSFPLAKIIWCFGFLILNLQDFLIDGASITNSESKKAPLINEELEEYEESYDLPNTLNNEYFKDSKKELSPSAIPRIEKNRHKYPTKVYAESLKRKGKSKLSSRFKNKWNLQPLQTQYKINPDLSYRLSKEDPDPYDLKMNVDGYHVRVISSPQGKNFGEKSHLKNDSAIKPIEVGHIIEILPIVEDSTISVAKKVVTTPMDPTLDDESIDCEDISEEQESLSDFEEGATKSELNLDDFANINLATVQPSISNEPAIMEDIMNMREPEEGSGDDEDGRALQNGFERDLNETQRDFVKSSRFFKIFSRSNEGFSVCTTPSGEPGHCKRVTQCLLSDALSNFSLFLQYLCMMGGPFVGICCPDNPVIEVSDGDNSTNITATEFLQPKEGCGKNSNVRIVGGTISLPHEWTWMVALMRRNRFFCGGVIINDWYILTAAHCVLGIKVKDLAVRLGEYNFAEKNEHQTDIPIAEIKRHAQFVTLTFQHDIALLKLKKKIEYSKFIGSICLPEQKSRDFTDINATVVGWGTVSFGGAASPVLRQVTIPVWSNEDCDKTYALESITDSFMCAGSPQNGEDACQGDSGGPLMALNDQKQWEVIGIVSWGRRCGDPTYPGVYTRVTTYLDWIKENIQ